MSDESPDDLVRASEIIKVPGSTKKPLIPVGISTWRNGVKSGRYPKPVQISDRIFAWRRSDIQKLIDGGV